MTIPCLYQKIKMSRTSPGVEGDQGGGAIDVVYVSDGEESRRSAVTSRNKRETESVARERLKEELLRQYEAGQIETPEQGRGSVVSCHREESDVTSRARHIPTIQEQRDKFAFYKRRNYMSPSLSYARAVSLPDVSRPPPGYIRPVQTVVPVPYYQPQSTYSYEDTIVSRVLQSLMNSRSSPNDHFHQINPKAKYDAGVEDKIMNWKTSLKGDEKRRPSERKSISRDRDSSISRGSSPRRNRSKRWKRYSSIDADTSRCRKTCEGDRRKKSKLTSRPVDDYCPMKRKRSSDDLDSKMSYVRSRSRSIVDHCYSKEISSERIRDSRNRPTSKERDKYIISRKGRLDSPAVVRDKDEKRGRIRRSSVRRGGSPKGRKIILLSPVRAGKSVREVIMDERDFKGNVVGSPPVKKRIKDRLGVRSECDVDVEVYNMDNEIGRCGAVALIKEYIDDTKGLLELRVSEGGRGAVILFNSNQVWIPDRYEMWGKVGFCLVGLR